MFDKLAIDGGSKAIPQALIPYSHIGNEEIEAVVEVLQSGILSGFVGSWGQAFYGGPEVQKFERAWERYFGVKHAIAVNSWTSGLICAIGAIGIEPGDEVIVSPWTMSATATSILHWNAIPVFADISKADFCISPSEVRKKITPRTRAILAVDIFGQSCNVEELLEIAEEFELTLILDSAQAPGAKRGIEFAGTRGHIGGFSLNYHKHIHCGEGGVVVTEDDDLAERVRMIRNHAEAVLEDRPWENYSNMLGFNFRLGEIEAAIGSQQLLKLAHLVERRQEIAKLLMEGFSGIAGISVPKVSEGNSHVYYMFPLILDLSVLKWSRAKIFDALLAEGVQGLTEGYTNLHLLPVYQRKQAYGSKNFPWSLRENVEDFNYSKGICPIAERLHDQELLILELCQFEYTDEDVKLTLQAFKKVFKHALI